MARSTSNRAKRPQQFCISPPCQCTPITAFTGMIPTAPISTFVRTVFHKTVTLTDAILEKAFNNDQLWKILLELQPLVQRTFRQNRERSRTKASLGHLIDFIEVYFVLFAHEHLSAGEKLALRW